MKSILPQTRRGDITFFHCGRIDITARVARMLALAAGDIINIAEHEGEFYLYVALRAERACGRYEATCRPTKRRSHNFRAHSARLCRAMLGKTGTGRSAFPAGNPVEMPRFGTCVPIITLNPLQR